MDLAEAEALLLEKWSAIQSWRARFTGQQDGAIRLGSNEFLSRSTFSGEIDFFRLNRSLQYREVYTEQLQHAETSKPLGPLATTELFSNGKTYHTLGTAPGRETHKSDKTDIAKSGVILAMPAAIQLTCLKKAPARLSCRGVEGNCIVLLRTGLPPRHFTWKERGLSFDEDTEIRSYDIETGVLVSIEVLSRSGSPTSWTDYVTEGIEFTS